MWLASEKIAVPRAGGDRRVVVAVPARDESVEIGACLNALVRSARRSAAPVTILVSANNCTDDTGAVARNWSARGATVLVEEITLPTALAHAGGARRDAMDRAADLVGPEGVIMTTDADSRVDHDWIGANLGEIAAGADAVAGMVTFDEVARSALPALADRAVEWQLAGLHARIEHLLDPRAHDPWPRHIWAWGASLAMTVAAYRAVGGVPVVPLAEDRALAEAIERAGLRLRRSYAPLVFTSPRRVGRAPGGFAELLDSYARNPATLCDAAIEPTAVLVRRLVARARLRAAGAFAEWPAIEAATPRLARRRLRPSQLDVEVALALRIIESLERRAARRADSPKFALAA